VIQQYRIYLRLILIQTNLSHIYFLFESSHTIGTEKTSRRIHLLNQISGPMLRGWNLSDSTIEVDGRWYHQCRLGPDRWWSRAQLHKDSDFGIKLTNTSPYLWKPHPQHERTEYFIISFCISNDKMNPYLHTHRFTQYFTIKSIVPLNLHQ